MWAGRWSHRAWQVGGECGPEVDQTSGHSGRPEMPLGGIHALILSGLGALAQVTWSQHSPFGSLRLCGRRHWSQAIVLSKVGDSGHSPRASIDSCETVGLLRALHRVLHPRAALPPNQALPTIPFILSLKKLLSGKGLQDFKRFF